MFHALSRCQRHVGRAVTLAHLKPIPGSLELAIIGESVYEKMMRFSDSPAPCLVLLPGSE